MNQTAKGRDINELIDSISEKYGYDDELNKTLKKVVPMMIDGKSDEITNMLFRTLERVRIFVLPYNATKEDIDRCKEEVFKNNNQDITFDEETGSEYGKGIAAGAYVNEPVFDENMNIIDKQSFLYVTKLSKYDKLAEVYGTDINLSHLIHELGHAWASEKEEFVQQEDGTYINNVGACAITASVDKENKSVLSDRYEGLFMEETLNTIEEEDTLCKLLGIESINELKAKGYVPSSYQGMMTDIMRSYVEKFGKERFDKFRFLKDREALKEIEESIQATEGWDVIQTKEYEDNKRAKFAKVNELNTTEGAKRIINGIFERYGNVYFPDNSKFTPMQKLENVYEQLYNFGAAKYNFDIINPQNLEIYKSIVLSMVNEGYVLKNQAKELPKEKDKEESSFMTALKGNVKADDEITVSNEEEIKPKIRTIEDKTIN